MGEMVRMRMKIPPINQVKDHLVRMLRRFDGFNGVGARALNGEYCIRLYMVAGSEAETKFLSLHPDFMCQGFDVDIIHGKPFHVN